MNRPGTRCDERGHGGRSERDHDGRPAGRSDGGRDGRDDGRPAGPNETLELALILPLVCLRR